MNILEILIIYIQEYSVLYILNIVQILIISDWYLTKYLFTESKQPYGFLFIHYRFSQCPGRQFDKFLLPQEEYHSYVSFNRTNCCDFYHNCDVYVYKIVRKMLCKDKHNLTNKNNYSFICILRSRL